MKYEITKAKNGNFRLWRVLENGEYERFYITNHTYDRRIWKREDGEYWLLLLSRPTEAECRRLVAAKRKMQKRLADGGIKP